MGIVDEGIARELDIIDTAIVESDGIIGSLDIRGVPVMGAMDEGVVQHFSLIAKEVKREGESVSHVVERNQRFLVLVPVRIEQHRLYVFLAVQVGARQVDGLGISHQSGNNKQEQTASLFLEFYTYRGYSLQK